MSIVTAPVPTATDSPQHARYQQALEFLFQRLNYEQTPDAARSLQDFKLSRMQSLLAELGNPQLSVPTVHIAGSKGKGSTATMIACIAEAAGYQVGLFTSPHVNRFEERFTINGQSPASGRVADLLERLRPTAEQVDRQSSAGRLTFFELATALSWLYFAEERVDLAVVEVGLGGRLDSTNVCSPLVSVITSISRDHTRLLGESLEAIAGEKAGIIKPGVPVVTTVAHPGAAEVIATRARECQSPLWEAERQFTLNALPLTPPPWPEPMCYRFDFEAQIETQNVRWEGLQLGMPGIHQTRNAAAAAAACLLLRERGLEIPESAIRTGLQRARCPLRVEVVGREPLLIVDAAHNPASIDALCTVVENLDVTRKRAIFATSRDKETSVLLQRMDGCFDEIWLTRYLKNPRSLELEELERIAAATLTKSLWRSLPSPAEALSAARGACDPRDLLCVTGSFFLAAEVRELLTPAGTAN